MYFASLVGAQIMGTLSPLYSFIAKFGPSRIFLLHTKRTEKEARSLFDYIDKRDLGEVSLIPIPDHTSEQPDSAAEIMARLAADARESSTRFCFNLDGGMNYLINDCVLRLYPYQPIFIQNSRWRCIAYDAGEENFFSLPLAEPLPVHEIMELQGMRYAPDAENPGNAPASSIVSICTSHKICLPSQHMKNVRSNGIFFDLVWNPGNNRLCFLKDWSHDKDRATRLARERDFVNWATDRSRSSQLFDKQVYALVNSSESQQRLTSQADQPVTVAIALYDEQAASALAQWFSSRSNGGKVQNLPACGSPNTNLLEDNTLVVCMGKNPASTFLALCSHKPAHLVLCYSERNKTVKGHAERVKQNAEPLGLASVQLVPFDVDGLYFDQGLPKPPAGQKIRVDVNITPGTKGQGAMLTLWARKHGFGIWSLHNKHRCCDALYNPENQPPIPFDLCDPLLYFRLLGHNLRDDYSCMDDMTSELPAMDAMLAFMRAALAKGKARDLFNRDVDIDGNILERPDREIIRLLQDGHAFEYTLKGGKWFEQLCAVALARAGAKHIRLNLAMRWKKETEAKIMRRKELDQVPHQLEVDVVGVFEGDLVLVSCKSYPNARKQVEADAKQTRDAGSHLGRFTLRILAHLSCHEATFTQDGQVLVIGWRELCQPEILKKKIAELRDRQTTTNA